MDRAAQMKSPRPSLKLPSVPSPLTSTRMWPKSSNFLSLGSNVSEEPVSETVCGRKVQTFSAWVHRRPSPRQPNSAQS